MLALLDLEIDGGVERVGSLGARKIERCNFLQDDRPGRVDERDAAIRKCRSDVGVVKAGYPRDVEPMFQPDLAEMPGTARGPVHPAALELQFCLIVCRRYDDRGRRDHFDAVAG